MEDPAHAPQPYTGPERRAHPRIAAASVPYLKAMMAGGSPVRLIDISKRGVQLETALHMQPGETVSIRFIADDATMTLTGAVVRCTSAVIDSGGGVTYHTGLAFTDELTLCADALDAAVQSSEGAVAPSRPEDGDYTMIVMDGRRGQEPPSHRASSEC